MNHDKPIFSKSQAGAEMFAAPDPTMRTRTRDFIQNYLTNILGQNTARQYAENIAGADPNNPMPRNPLGIGAADFTPLGLLFAGQEIKRDFDKASRPLDYVAPTIGGALSIAEAFPLTKVMVKGVSKPVAGFLSNLNRKSVADESNLTIPEKPEPLMTSPGPKTTRDDETNLKPPKTVSRRTVLKGLAAAPVAAGALSNIPAGKIVDDVVKEGAVKVSKKVPISSFKNMLTNSVQMRRAVLKQEVDRGGMPDMEEILVPLDPQTQYKFKQELALFIILMKNIHKMFALFQKIILYCHNFQFLNMLRLLVLKTILIFIKIYMT